MSPEGKQRVMEQLKIDEGVVHEVYLDHLGLPTVGIGHLILESDPEHGSEVGTPISEERCEELFMHDLGIALTECEILYGAAWFHFPEEVQEILVNMLFNMGRPRLTQFKKMNSAIEAGEWATAAVEGRDSRWHKQVGNRAERLMTRLEAV
jgi:GH24 family phage-related lysozyme (muramidase)